MANAGRRRALVLGMSLRVLVAVILAGAALAAEPAAPVERDEAVDSDGVPVGASREWTLFTTICAKADLMAPSGFPAWWNGLALRVVDDVDGEGITGAVDGWVWAMDGRPMRFAGIHSWKMPRECGSSLEVQVFDLEAAAPPEGRAADRPLRIRLVVIPIVDEELSVRVLMAECDGEGKPMGRRFRRYTSDVAP